MTEQPTPAGNGKHDDDAQASPEGVIHSMSGQPEMSQRNLQAPAEQPYYVPTAQQQAHQQAWSATQQYPFHPQAPYGQAPYGQQPPYGQAPVGYAYGQPMQAPYGQHPQYGGSGQLPPYGPYGGVGFWTPPPVPKKSRPHKMLYGSVAAAVATALAVGGVALAVDHANNGSSQQTALNTPAQTNPFSQNGSGTGGFGSGNTGGGTGSDGLGGSDGSSGTGSSGTTGTTGTATSTQSVGIVDINTTLDFGEGKAAGTGMVLTSDGEILTNNHVVEDSTAITVTVVSTGKTYSASVVGTDPTDDVAVIQLKDASGLATAKLGDSSTVKAGTAVTAVGNAGGTGGTPTSASGSVTAINQSITASDESGANAEKLTGMIEVNANIQAGDSGGALYEDASGTIIGMNTAASSSSASRFGASTATTGFAIPIAKATDIAKQIESGTETSTIHIGYPAFFGVQLSAAGQTQTTGGATISGVVKGSAAETAGLAAGDTITAVDGKAIASSTALSAVTATHNPGDKVSVTFTNSAGKSQTVTVTLGQGPAD